jgi:hypothetical protein
MRPDIINPDTGERVSFRDFKEYRKLEFLVAGADCDTRAGVITAWRDTRPQPSYDEIEAVLDADVDAAEEAHEEDSVAFHDALKKLAKVSFAQENRLRALEAKQPVTWRQFIKVVKAL